ncbi:MAG: mechanosensitive ion channel family protein [Planctomycetota bacterium]|jgi:small conductance mechanosensitive channel
MTTANTSAVGSDESLPDTLSPAGAGSDESLLDKLNALLADSDLQNQVIAFAGQVVMVLIALFAAWLIAGWTSGLVQRGLTRAKIEETLTIFFAKLTRWGILILTVLGCMQSFGINTTSFAAVIAAAGFAIGMALQGTLSNFSAGVMLLIFRPFKVGDFVITAGESGTVAEIDLFTSTINTPDNRRIIIPNGSIFGSVIENVSANSQRRVDVVIGVAYDADLDHTREVLNGVAESITNRLSEHPIDIILAELGASSVDWKIRVWTDSEHYWQVREDILVAAKKALDAADIGIPFPQLDVHMIKQG